MLCNSCGVPLTSYEMGDFILLEDGTKVPETFCRRCVKEYVTEVDDLNTKEYQFEHLTDMFYGEFITYSE